MYEKMYVPGPFAFRQGVFTRAGDYRMVLDIANQETIQACEELRNNHWANPRSRSQPVQQIPAKGHVGVVIGAYPDARVVWMSSKELELLMEKEGWHARPSPEGEARQGLWDGRGEWMEVTGYFDANGDWVGYEGATPDELPPE